MKDEIKERIVEAFNNTIPYTPMSEQEMKIFHNIISAKEQEFSTVVQNVNIDSPVYAHFKPLIQSFQGQVLLKRLEVFSTVKLTLGAFLSILVNIDKVTSAVMYAFYMHNKVEPNTIITIKEISEVLFPFGFFSEEQLHELWIIQKLTSEERGYNINDNGLDLLYIWEK